MGRLISVKERSGRTVIAFTKWFTCMVAVAALTAAMFFYFVFPVEAAAPVSQNFDGITAGTKTIPFTYDGVTYSTDSQSDPITVDMISSITGGINSLGTGKGLSSGSSGDAAATYFQFASESNADNFKLTSFNAEVWGYGSQNSVVYRLDGYDNGQIKATATVNFSAPDTTYGSGNDTISYNRLTTTQEEIDTANCANGGLLSFTGSAWANIDQLRMTVADSGPNTFMTVIIDNLTLTALPSATTGIASNVSYTSATLNGAVNDNGASTAVTFEYGTTVGYGTIAAATTGGTVAAGAGSTAASVGLTGLSANTTYHYRVKAVNSAGTTYGSDQTFNTLAPAQTATSSAATTTPNTGAADSVTLTVKDSLGNTDSTFNG
ncbi:MAG: hypothetical protein K0Q73_2902, partial [Paenibacillus sp.]|nr:hypothetical protein [Paenibacillus sp.]